MKPKVVIAGAGVAGLASACALVQRGWHATVLDRRPDLSEGGRAILVQPNGIAALERLGALARVRDRGQLLSRVVFYGQDHRPIAAWRYGALRHPHPYAIEIRPAHLRDALAERLAELQAEPPRFGCEFVALSPGGAGAAIAHYRDSTGSENGVEGALLVGADGPGSAVRSALGIACRYLPLRDLYLLGTVDVAGDGDELAVHLGPGYGDGVVPLGDGTYFWDRVTDENRGAVEARDLEGWRQVYERRLPPGSVLPGAVTSWTQVTAVEVRPFWAARQVGDSAALVGDAAGVVHPHSAQGANLALEDAVALGDALAEHDGATPIPRPFLPAYARPRQRRRRRFVLQSLVAARIMDGPTPFWRSVRQANLVWSRAAPFERVLLKLGST